MERSKLFFFNTLVLLILVSWARSGYPRKFVSDSSDSTGALLYLSRFGYMTDEMSNPMAGALTSDKSVVSNIIKRFQAFAGINVTGVLDEETVEMMNTPRCGVQDKIGHGANAKRRKRYALQGSRWRVRNLTYSIANYPVELTKAEVDRECREAFQTWEDVTDLTFKQVDPSGKSKIHIEIRFESGEHGDGDSFDGPGGTLAHAFFPIYGGDAHFDESEHWSVKSKRGTNLFQVAAHEFGHSLGLSHSDVQTSLMAPFYRGYNPTFRLDKDDIKAIQKLYGEGKKKKPAEKPVKPNTRGYSPEFSTNAICSKEKIDAIVTMSDDKTYVFIGSQYWRLSSDSVAKGYPRNISDDFDGLPNDLDGGFTWTQKSTFFFKGSSYWKFTNKTMNEGYPKNISVGFNGIPDDIDTVFVWSGNGKIYFFKGAKYWRFDDKKLPPVTNIYPKEVSSWKYIPNNLDAALQYSNGFTYFFKNKEYWRFNDRKFIVDDAIPPFPRSTDYWWFGCLDKDIQEGQVNQNKGIDESPNFLGGADDVSGDRKFDAVSADGD